MSAWGLELRFRVSVRGFLLLFIGVPHTVGAGIARIGFRAPLPNIYNKEPKGTLLVIV